MNKYAKLYLFALIVFTLAIRLFPILTNATVSYWHDENNYIEQALRLGSGNFGLFTFVHGGLFYILLFIEYAIYYFLGALSGYFSSSADFYLKYLSDPAIFFIIARITSCLFGAGIVYMTYLVTLKMFNCVRIAFFSAAFSSFSLIMLQMSLFGLADIPAVFLLLLSFLALVSSINKQNDSRMYYLACLILGLAVACKYYTVFGVLTVYIAAFIKSLGFKDRFRGVYRLSLFGSFFIFLGFCIGMPFFLMDFGKFYQEAFLKIGTEYIVNNPNKNMWLFYFTHHLRNGLGIPLGILSLCAAGYAIYKRSKWDILLISFPVAHYLLFMHSAGLAYHLLPVIPFIIILAARFLDVISRKVFLRFGPVAYVCLGVMMILPTAIDSAKFIKIVSGPDTRDTAKAWIEENIPDGAKIIEEGCIAAVAIHSPAIIGNLDTLKRDLDYVVSRRGSGFSMKMKIANFDRLYGKKRSYAIFRTDKLSSDDVGRLNAAYIVMTGDNDNMTGDELSYCGAPKEYYAEREELKKAMLRKYMPIRSFVPSDEMTEWFPHLADHDYVLIRAASWNKIEHYVKGPRIDIFKLKE